MLEIGTQTHPRPHQAALYILLYRNQVLIEADNQFLIPFTHFQPNANMSAVYCGQWHGQDIFVCRFEAIPKGFTETGLRELLFLQDQDHYLLLSRAHQLATWDRDHQFCGRCGTPMEGKHAKEHAKMCSSCNLRHYPRISPCIIVSIRKGEQILLARGPQAPKGRYSNLAGFVEAGETLEQAVAREVREEVGIEITNIRYVSSQPWSFPHQLMTGFFADYLSGDITPAPGEIEEAAWWPIDALPSIPNAATISGQIILQHVEHIKQSQSRST
ncbi:NAD(+) diphosphatase [Marinomonas sp. M1K-6]|uniref:NAD(+) diphosphatase n=1 Tax=Marinomonas profundi TaxID=2726122 RepID=A0A847RAT0_9GAMM|nr:NAD(+) diphosphatase [Marinomonas profundi]NLQ18064.1 NAD(+) diphosphatase [Marinomonas profundi]UDV04148.1 NAD(+) diphosphatase [Marinomonas profundi]